MKVLDVALALLNEVADKSHVHAKQPELSLDLSKDLEVEEDTLLILEDAGAQPHDKGLKHFSEDLGLPGLNAVQGFLHLLVVYHELLVSIYGL